MLTGMELNFEGLKMQNLKKNGILVISKTVVTIRQNI